MHKYTEAAVKIQTRYRAYKSTSLSSSKGGYQYRNSVGSKLQAHHFNHHNSIDETSVTNTTSNIQTNNLINPDDDPLLNKRLIGSDLQLNNCHVLPFQTSASSSASSSTTTATSSTNTSSISQQHQKLVNQKQIARKLMNMRQSPRFSPASPMSPMSPASSINTIPSSNSSNSNSTSIQLQPATTNTNNQIINGTSTTAADQLHHHHHHHHHFHHHFHNKNKNEIQQAQMIDRYFYFYLFLFEHSNNFLFLSNSPYRRKISDIQPPSLINPNSLPTSLSTTQLVVSEVENMIQNNDYFDSGQPSHESPMLSSNSCINNQTNSINNSFDSDSNSNPIMSPITHSSLHIQNQPHLLQSHPNDDINNKFLMNSTENYTKNLNRGCLSANHRSDSCGSSGTGYVPSTAQTCER